MTENQLRQIRAVIEKLVAIANGSRSTKLTPREAYLAVRVMDLTEGFISKVEDFNL